MPLTVLIGCSVLDPAVPETCQTPVWQWDHYESPARIKIVENGCRFGSILPISESDWSLHFIDANTGLSVYDLSYASFLRDSDGPWGYSVTEMKGTEEEFLVTLIIRVGPKVDSVRLFTVLPRRRQFQEIHLRSLAEYGARSGRTMKISSKVWLNDLGEPMALFDTNVLFNFAKMEIVDTSYQLPYANGAGGNMLECSVDGKRISYLAPSGSMTRSYLNGVDMSDRFGRTRFGIDMGRLSNDGLTFYAVSYDTLYADWKLNDYVIVCEKWDIRDIEKPVLIRSIQLTKEECYFSSLRDYFCVAKEDELYLSAFKADEMTEYKVLKVSFRTGTIDVISTK